MKDSITYRLPDYSESKCKEGAWYSIEYGFQRIEVCVIQACPHTKMLLLENPRWLFSASEWMESFKFFSPWHKPIFLGYGKPRLIVGWLRRNMDCIGTLYTRPKHAAAAILPG